MIKSIRVFLISSLFVLPLFIANCSATDPTTDGPSCFDTTGRKGMCFDSLATDLISNLSFQGSCSVFGGSFNSFGCNMVIYSINGHCEFTTSAVGNIGFGVNTAVYYSPSLYANSTIAQAACTAAGGIWK